MVLGSRDGGGRGKDGWREQGVVMFRGGWVGEEEVKVSWGVCPGECGDPEMRGKMGLKLGRH